MGQQHYYYRVLHVPHGATATDIHRAYWRLSHAYHARLGAKPSVAPLMERLNEAYRVLATPDLRHLYDSKLVITTDAPKQRRRFSWLRWWKKGPSP